MRYESTIWCNNSYEFTTYYVISERENKEIPVTVPVPVPVHTQPYTINSFNNLIPKHSSTYTNV